jgi:hypothetical protein
VLDARKLGLELLELTWTGVDLVHAPRDEGRLVELLARRTAALAHALELRSRLGRCGKRVLIRRERIARGRARPGVEHLDVRPRVKEALVLVLAAEVDRRAHLGRELAHARHAAVKLHAAPPVRGHAPTDHHVLPVART